MKFVIIVTHIKAGDSNENGKERSAISKFRLCLSGDFYLCPERTEYEDSLCGKKVLVVIAGVILKISAIEWCICMVLFGLVMALEHVNTAVEAVVDMVTEEYHPLAKVAKDTAAGAVLIAAIMAAIAGCIIFLPKIAQILQ